MAALDRSRDTISALDRNDHQVYNPFDLHYDEDILLHATIGDVDDRPYKKVITMHLEEYLGRIGMVDIANFEFDPLVYQIHLPCPPGPMRCHGRN